MSMLPRRSDLLKSMAVTVPEGEVDGMAVRRVEVTGSEISTIRDALTGRPIPPGTYTVLVERNDTGWEEVWMSDTPAERFDHWAPVLMMWNLDARRVLINGLGLGMVVRAALDVSTVEHIDVVEKDARVIQLVAPHYERDARVRVHHGDALEVARGWPRGTSWDVAWHDIWPAICSDNLAEMTRLHRSYGRRVRWQGSWGRVECLRQRRRYDPYR